LIAHTIEFDNEFEHRMPHTTTRGPQAHSRLGPWLVCMTMWSNFLRNLDDEAVPLRDKQGAADLTNLSLAISANVLRVLDTSGRRVTDLPALAGLSKVAVAVSGGLAPRRLPRRQLSVGAVAAPPPHRYRRAMADLYSGTAIFSMPKGPTVEAEVDLWIEEHGPLVEWGGTAEAHEPGILWNGGQQVSSVKFGDLESGYRIGECIIETREPGDVERVTLRGSGVLAEVDSEQSA
jgi:hypothetical protein